MQWRLKIVDIEELVENEENPRILSNKQAKELEKSIARFGLCEPIVVDVDFTIIGGHQRYRILRKRNEKSVPVFIPDFPLTQRDRKELSIRLNKNCGDWDWDVLANLWDIDDLLTWGFDEEEFDLEEKPKDETKKINLVIKSEDSEQLSKIYEELEKFFSDKEGINYKIKIKNG